MSGEEEEPEKKGIDVDGDGSGDKAADPPPDPPHDLDSDDVIRIDVDGDADDHLRADWDDDNEDNDDESDWHLTPPDPDWVEPPLTPGEQFATLRRLDPEDPHDAGLIASCEAQGVDWSSIWVYEAIATVPMIEPPTSSLIPGRSHGERVGYAVGYYGVMFSLVALMLMMLAAAISGLVYLYAMLVL